jgi:hypothetical protein
MVETLTLCLLAKTVPASPSSRLLNIRVVHDRLFVHLPLDCRYFLTILGVISRSIVSSGMMRTFISTLESMFQQREQLREGISLTVARQTDDGIATIA